ncbi:MAG: MerR family transcriptional regulator [Thermoleophilia bacterium]
MTTADLTSIAACSLDPDGMAQRAADLRGILAPALRDLRRAGAAAELDLALDSAEERALAELLRLERECCPFWRFSLSRRSARLVRLRVRAEAPYEAALDALLSLTRERGGAPTGARPQELAFRAGEAARRAGVGVETLRYYERRGLIPAPARRPSGQREYKLDDIRLVRAIKMAQRLGFTLAQTKEIVRVTRRRGGHDPAVLREQVEAKLAEVEDKIRDLELMRAELRAVIAAECDSLVDCECGDDCPIDPEAPVTVRGLQVIR